MGPGNECVVDFPIASAKLNLFFESYKCYRVFILILRDSVLSKMDGGKYEVHL